MNSESVKMKNNKNDKYFEIDKSSRIFQKLFLKYNRKKIKKPKTILSIYEAKKMKAENLQTEREFVINELRAHIRLNKELESNMKNNLTREEAISKIIVEHTECTEDFIRGLLGQ